MEANGSFNGSFHIQGHYLNDIITKLEKRKSLVAQLNISGLCSIINHTLGDLVLYFNQSLGFQSVLASSLLSQPCFSVKR